MILVCHATYVARPMRAIKPKPPGAALCPHDDQLGRPTREATCRMSRHCSPPRSFTAEGSGARRPPSVTVPIVMPPKMAGSHERFFAQDHPRQTTKIPPTRASTLASTQILTACRTSVPLRMRAERSQIQANVDYVFVNPKCARHVLV